MEGTTIRFAGVPGNWQKTLDCIESLYPLKENTAIG